MSSFRTLAQLEAAGTPVTNTAAEAVLYSHLLPAYSLQVGKRYKLRAAVRATVTNGTDTARIRLRTGPTTLTGTVIFDATAVDVANDDLVIVEVEGIVRAIGTSAIVLWSGFGSIEGAEGTVTARAAFESDPFDATIDNRIELTALWSAASASDSCQAEAFTLDEIVG
jgi:hypothetical protein